ncbi:Rhs family protein [Myxococcus hansupus]|uniref:Rhs family protein n=1 Tax=Pseudomyxococcus hansupus TaxID=1297742 RepID=A0A0H4WU65_9BACT|nr:Rhs family protein [Myxococcus hansupus]
MDAQGRKLETHGPCFVDESADVAMITGCQAGTVFPVVKYEYWAMTETGHKRNQLKKKSVLPGGCTGTTSLDTQYLDYDVYGNATRVQDVNGLVVERQYNQSQMTSQTVVSGSVSTTTLASFDNGKLKAIQYPQGNYDVFCYRTGTTTGLGCVGGTPTYLLQWVAKAADASGANWAEKVEYAYWPDETVKTKTFLAWTGTVAETRRVVSFAADARRNPTYQGLGNVPSSVVTTRLFDANGNLTGIGFPSNEAPAVCGGPDSEGQPVSPLCASLGYDRLNRLAKLDEFPSAGVSQRTCFSYDVHSNVTAARQGCVVAAGNECGSCSAGSPASEYAYDDFGNLVWAKLPHTQDGVGGAGTTRYSYNALGLLVDKATPEMQAHGERVSHTYDAAGRLLRRNRHYLSSSNTQMVQNLFVLSYDVTDAGDVTSTPPMDCPQPANTRGRLRYQHDSFGRTWYQYDALGRLTGEVRLREGQTSCSSAGLNDKPHTFYTYTANGNVDSITYPHGRVVKYVYGTGATVDRVQAVDVRLWSSSGFLDTRLIQGVVWEPYGQLRGYQVNHPTTSNSSAVEYMLGDNSGSVPAACPAAPPIVASGDLTGRLRALRVSTGTLAAGAGSGDIYKQTYTWHGDQVSQVDTCVLGATTPRIETFGYDRSLKLVSAERPMGNVAATGGAYASRNFGYDNRGNRTSMSADGSSYAFAMTSAPAVDRLAEWGATAPGSLLRYALAYDADGRVTSQRWAPGVSGTPVFLQGFEYGIDESAQIGVATDTVFRAVNRNGVTYNYFYDAQGRRRLKAYPGGTKDEYFNSAAHRLLTDRGSDGFVAAVGHYTTDDYVWLGGKSVAVIRAKFSSAWVRQADGAGDCSRNEESAACGVYFPVVDHSGKPVVMLDGSRRVAGSADYDPFGHVNRMLQMAETAHPYTSGSSVSLATLTQPVGAGPEVVRMRALYHLLDTESGEASVSLVDVDTAASLHSTSLARQGNVMTPWVQPSNGRVAVRFDASATATSNYQGVVLEGYEYQRYQSGAQPFWLPLRFPGQYYDAETGYFENWNRFYNPSEGRYIQPEPLVQSPRTSLRSAGGGHVMAVYSYGQSNPVGFVDRTGFKWNTAHQLRHNEEAIRLRDKEFWQKVEDVDDIELRFEATHGRYELMPNLKPFPTTNVGYGQTVNNIEAGKCVNSSVNVWALAMFRPHRLKSELWTFAHEAYHAALMMGAIKKPHPDANEEQQADFFAHRITGEPFTAADRVYWASRSGEILPEP